jgi:hypothetical protein
MLASASPFVIARSIRVPGLGLLILPTDVPDWLASYSIHTALALSLHRLNQSPLSLTATIEELEYDLQVATRGLLINSVPTEIIPVGSWLIIEAVVPDKLL